MNNLNVLVEVCDKLADKDVKTLNRHNSNYIKCTYYGSSVYKYTASLATIKAYSASIWNNHRVVYWIEE